MAINRNEMAKAVTLEEGKSVSINIGQVKEVQRLVLEYLAAADPAEVDALLSRVRRRGANWMKG